MGNRNWHIQLKDRASGEAIITAGGMCFVALAGDALKASLKDRDGAALSNPLSLNRGAIDFYVVDTVEAVDLYILAPGGEFVVRKNVKPSGPNEFDVDTAARHQALVIPWAAADITAAVETATGFTEPTKALMLPYPTVDVLAVDATETIDVGTLSTDSGDADGFVAAVSVANQGLVKATILNGANTLGALFEIQDSANAGDLTHEGRVSAGKSITLTLSAGSDTGKGFIHLPYYLAR